MSKERDETAVKLAAAVAGSRQLDADLAGLRNKHELTERQLQDAVRDGEASRAELDAAKKLLVEREANVADLKEQRRQTEEDLEKALQDAEKYAKAVSTLTADIQKAHKEKEELAEQLSVANVFRAKHAEAESLVGELQRKLSAKEAEAHEAAHSLDSRFKEQSQVSAVSPSMAQLFFLQFDTPFFKKRLPKNSRHVWLHKSNLRKRFELT